MDSLVHKQALPTCFNVLISYVDSYRYTSMGPKDSLRLFETMRRLPKRTKSYIHPCCLLLNSYNRL